MSSNGKSVNQADYDAKLMRRKEHCHLARQHTKTNRRTVREVKVLLIFHRQRLTLTRDDNESAAAQH